eukprot:470773-Amphidinium_carterae.1
MTLCEVSLQERLHGDSLAPFLLQSIQLRWLLSLNFNMRAGPVEMRQTRVKIVTRLTISQEVHKEMPCQ